MKLSTWINNNGGTGKTATLLGVNRNNVYAWQKGLALPRPKILKLIQKKSAGKVGLGDMVDEYLEKSTKLRKVESKKRKTSKKK